MLSTEYRYSLFTLWPLPEIGFQVCYVPWVVLAQNYMKNMEEEHITNSVAHSGTAPHQNPGLETSAMFCSLPRCGGHDALLSPNKEGKSQESLSCCWFLVFRKQICYVFWGWVMNLSYQSTGVCILWAPTALPAFSLEEIALYLCVSEINIPCGLAGLFLKLLLNGSGLRPLLINLSIKVWKSYWLLYHK